MKIDENEKRTETNKQTKVKKISEFFEKTRKHEVNKNQHQHQNEKNVLEERGKVNNFMNKGKEKNIQLQVQKENVTISIKNTPVSNEKKVRQSSENASKIFPIFNTTNQGKSENKAHPNSSPASHHHPQPNYQGLKSKAIRTKHRPEVIRSKPIDAHFPKKSESCPQPAVSLKPEFSGS